MAGNRAAEFWTSIAACEHAVVMGVVNVTPDSFSDAPGHSTSPQHTDGDTAGTLARAMIAAGAAIVDIGGESTRPGAAPVSEEEELARVGPALTAVRDLPVSIDTRRARVAQAALDAGAILVNDVTAGSDPALFPLVAERGAGLVLMHMRGTPATMQEEPVYDDVVGEVESYLLARAAAARSAGVARDRLLIDPGIGFGKTAKHNLALLHALPRLARHGYPVLLGISRKSLLGTLTGRAVGQRHDATTAAVALGAAAGAAVVRVHDVPAALDAVRIAAAWPRA